MNQILINEQACPVLARGVRLQKDSKTGEPVLLFPEGVLYLSATAHEIVKHCDGQTTAAAIISSLANEYDVDEETLRADVLECLADLIQRKVIVLGSRER
jgi:coenzyme PQQ biosynthesis protein PqqD